MPTEEELEALEQDYWSAFWEAAPDYYRNAITTGHAAEMKVRSISPVLSFFAIRRQEKLAKTQIRLARAIIVLTCAVVVVALLQLGAMAFVLPKG